MNSMMLITIRVQSAQAQRALAQVQAQTKGVTAEASRASMAAGKMSYGLPMLSKWGNQVQWAGRQLQYNFTLPLLLAAGAATKFQLDNEKAMTRVVKVYGDAQHSAQQYKKEIDSLSKAFEVLSNRFGVHQSEVINIAADWAAAGASGVALARSVGLTLQTMVLGEMNAADATQALISIQAQYGQSTKGLAKTIDILNMVENQTGISMEGLIQGFSRTAGVARSTGVDVRHLAALLAALTPASGSAANAGNALKTVFSRLLAPTKDAQDVLGLLGIKMNDVNWKSLTAVQRIELMAKKYEDLGKGLQHNSRALDSNGKATGRLISAQQAVVSSTIASRWQINRWDVLMRDVANKNGYYAKSLRSTADATANFRQRQFELNQVLNSNPQRLKQMWVILQNALAHVIQPMIPYLVYLAQTVANLAQHFANMNPFLQKTILFGLALLAVVGPLARYVGSVSTLFGILSATLHWVLVRLGLATVATTTETGAIEMQRRGLIGLIGTWLTFPFRMIGKGFWNLATGMGEVLGWMLRTPALLKAASAAWWTLRYAAWGAFVVTRLAALMMGPALGMGLKLMAGQVAKFNLASMFSAMWGAILSIFRTGSAATTATTASTAKAQTIIQGVAAKFRVGMAARTASQILAIEAGSSKAVVADESAAAKRRSEILAALRAYIVSLYTNMNAAVNGIEAGASAERLALAAAASAEILAAQEGYTAARLALEAGLYGNMLAIETGYYSASMAGGAAYIEWMLGIMQAYNAAMRGLEAGAGASRLALESSIGAERIALENAVQGEIIAAETLGATRTLELEAGTATARVGIFSRMFGAIKGIISKIVTIIPLMLSRVGPMLLRVVLGWPGLIIAGLAAIIGIAYRFRDQIAQAWSNVVQFFQHGAGGFTNAMQPIISAFDRMRQALINAFYALPSGIRNALVAVVKVVRAAAMEVYKWFQWMNPWARHSPSLVDNVKTGMGTVQDHHKRTLASAQQTTQAVVANHRAVNTVTRSSGGGASADLSAYQKVADNLQMKDFQASRNQVSKSLSAQLPLFDRLLNDYKRLLPLERAQEAAVNRQQAVVDKWKAALDKANDALDAQQKKLDAMQKHLETLQAAYDGHKQAMQDWANTPIAGMQAMDDAIFNNQQAQKKLQLQMLQWQQANGSIDSITSKLNDMNGAIEQLQGQKTDLRVAGAGSDITGPIQDQINMLQGQAKQMQDLVNNSPMAQWQKQLDQLDLQGQIMDLQKSLKFDGPIRQIDQLVNGMKEMPFDQILAGVQSEKNAMAALQPQLDAANAAVEKQKKVVDAATAARDAIDARYQREQKRLDSLNATYQKTQDLVNAISDALNRMGQAADSAQAKANAAARKHKGPKPPKIGTAAQSFMDAAGGGFPDPGQLSKIGREGGWGDQSKLIDQFAKDQADLTSKAFAKLNPFDPLKKWWHRTWAWLKENIGPVVEPVVAGVHAATKGLGDVWKKLSLGFKLQGSGIGGKVLVSTFGGLVKAGANIRKAFDAVVHWLKNAWHWGLEIAKLFGPDLKRIWDALINTGKDIWKNWGPQLAKFGHTLGLLRDAFVNVAKIVGPILVVAFKLLASIITTTLGPVLHFLIKVIGDVLQIIRGLLDFVLGILAGRWKSAFMGLLDVVTGVFSAIGNILGGAIMLIWKPIEGFFRGIWEICKWVYDELVGHSIIPDLVNGIKAWFGKLVGIGKWLWSHSFGPIIDFAKKLFHIGMTVFSWWWGGIQKEWRILKGLGTWIWNHVLKPVWNWVKSLWDKYVKPAFAFWWRGITNVWNALKGLGRWVWNNVLSPVWNWIKNLWPKYVKPALAFWWRGITNVWNDLTRLGSWIWNHVMSPVVNKIKDGWNNIKDWLTKNKGMLTNPVKGVVNAVVSAVNTMIKGLNKISDVLPGVNWHIDLIPKLAEGGMPLAKRVGAGFKTQGARAIVGEGKANHPEYVIPTDPTHRKRALGLFTDLGRRLGIGALPNAGVWGQTIGDKQKIVNGLPAYDIGGILGDIKNAAKGAGHWIHGNVHKLASAAFWPFKKAAQWAINKVGWPPAHSVAQWGLNKISDFVTLADKDAAAIAQQYKKNHQGGYTGKLSGNQRIAKAQKWAISQEGKPYVWGGVGPGGYDCSGFMAAITNVLMGRNPYHRLGSTANFPWPGFQMGSGSGFTIGSTNNYGGSGIGHMAGTLGGINVESRGGDGVVIGRRARGWTDPGFGIDAHLMGLANGAIIKARRGGVLANIGEGRHDEAVVPLPQNWRTDIIGTQGKPGGDTTIIIQGNLEFPNITSGDDAETFIENLKILSGKG